MQCRKETHDMTLAAAAAAAQWSLKSTACPGKRKTQRGMPSVYPLAWLVVTDIKARLSGRKDNHPLAHVKLYLLACLLACLLTPSLLPTFSCHHNSGNNEMKELFVTIALFSGHVQFCQDFVVESVKAVSYLRQKEDGNVEVS